MKNKFFLIFALLLMGFNFLWAGDPLLGGNEAMKAGGTEIKSWIWVVSLGILGLGVAVTFFVYDKKFKQEETDTQHKTSAFKLGATLLITFIATEILIFLVLGTMGKAFLGMSFGDTWNMFVIKPLRALLGLQ